MISNKKGNVVMFIIVWAVFLFLIILVISFMDIGKTDLELAGETSLKIVNAFEATERTYTYIDASVDMASRIAAAESLASSGSILQVFKGKTEGRDCGTMIFPLLNEGKDTDKCRPKFEDSFRVNFYKHFSRLLDKYAPFALSVSDFDISLTISENDLKIKVFALNDLEMPIYSFIESYYADFDKTIIKKEKSTDIYYKNEQGYFERGGLYSEPRRSRVISKVIVHETFTNSISETYNNLRDGSANYHYVIDKDGVIYQFAQEDRITKNANCDKDIDSGCKIENADSFSINVGLVSCSISREGCIIQKCLSGPFAYCFDPYDLEGNPSVQFNKLSELLADIASRNPGFEINADNVLGANQVSSSFSDPGPAFFRRKSKIIDDAVKIASILPDNDEGGEKIELEPLNINNQKPTFTNIYATVYWTPDYFGSKQWYSGESPCTDSLGYCCIPDDKRGFYEEVKCQGSGLFDGALYRYDTIKTSQAESKPVEGFTRGITRLGTDPTPMRTVAVNIKENTPCYIPLGTKMYVYFEKDNPWNGFYVAEDTGKAMQGKCKMDFYAGVGEQARDEAIKYVSGKYPKIYILDDSFEIPDVDFSGFTGAIASVSGTYSSRYSHEYKLKGFYGLMNDVYDFVKDSVNDCYDLNSFDDRKLCVEKLIDKYNNEKKVFFDPVCKIKDYPQGSIYEKSIDKNVVDLAGFVKSKHKSSTTYTVVVSDDTGEIELNLKEQAIPVFDKVDENDVVVVKNSVYESDGVRSVLASQDFLINPFNAQLEYLKPTVVQAADCTTSNNYPCGCSAEYYGRSDYLNFSSTKISFSDFSGDDFLIVPFKFINEFDNNKGTYFSYNVKKEGSVLYFALREKGKLSLVKKSVFDTLDKCVPQRKYWLMCAYIPSDFDYLYNQVVIDSKSSTQTSFYSPVVSLNQKQQADFDSTVQRLSSNKIADGRTWLEVVISSSEKYGLPKEILLAKITQDSKGENYAIDLNNSKYEVGITRIEAFKHIDGIKSVCGEDLVSECNSCNDIKTCCEFKKFREDVECQLNYEASLLKNNNTYYSDDAKYEADVKKECSIQDRQDLYLSYKGWDRALRSVKGFACSDIDFANYVTDVNLWAAAWGYTSSTNVIGGEFSNFVSEPSVMKFSMLI